MELYRLRWQVELSIKRDKSIGGLDRLPNFRADTIRSWILAKLLLAQIARKIATANVAIPPVQPNEPVQAKSSSDRRRRRSRDTWYKAAVAEPWRVMVFVWQALMAALLPISLRNVPLRLKQFLDHLQRSVDSPRQAELFEQRLREESG